ncbi:MAG: InlB B-repeat-containing protein, partial [Spirochaetaceae bacterium]|nr:InlB B-repeat-containing protein [Spirochaetaceae bacterium]
STTFNQHEGRTSLPTPTSNCSGVTFAGWYENSSYTGNSVTSIDIGTNHDVDLYAKWTTTISFDANGSSDSFTPLNDVVIGRKITVPSPGPTRNNYVFTGWYKNSGCAEADRFKFSDPIDKGMTLYAGWQQVNESGTRDTYFENDAGISITDNADGDTTYCLRLNDNTVSGIGTALAVTNNTQGTTTTAYLDIQGTNSFAGSNHGGLKLTTATSGAKTIKIVFCTSSSGTITLYGDRGCIQVENVTATFELMSGCKATEMKIGSTTYTDFNTFVTDMRTESVSRNKTATLKIERE